MIDDPVPGDGPRPVRPEILFDHGQREIDPGGHSGRGPHRAIDDEDAVCLHFHFWKASLQFARAVPVGGRSSAVEQTCLSEDEGTSADRGDTPASPWSLPHKFD